MWREDCVFTLLTKFLHVESERMLEFVGDEDHVATTVYREFTNHSCYEAHVMLLDQEQDQAGYARHP